MRSALIIGAAGQDGRLLTDFLHERDYRVLGWTRTAPTCATGCEFETVDLQDPLAVAQKVRTAQPNEIYYLAAYHHSTEERAKLCQADLLKRSLEVNVVGLQNVLEAVKVTNRAARLFYAASSHVFGAPKIALQDEETPFLPTSAYAISKAAGLRCCQKYRGEDGLFAASGILFNHESILRPPTFLSQKIVQGALRARRDPRFNLALRDLSAQVDWGYAPDYVEAMFRILQLPKADDFVMASGETHSVQEFAEIAFAEVGLNWSDHVMTDCALSTQASPPLCGNSTKLRKLTNWSPSLTFPEMVRRLVRDAQYSSTDCVSLTALSESRGRSHPIHIGRETTAPPFAPTEIAAATGMSVA